MSVVEVSVPVTAGRRPPLFSTRMYRSELTLIFGRRRNQMGLVVLGIVPIIIGIALKIAGGDGSDGPPLLSGVTRNGLFLAMAALFMELPLFLPLAVAAISSDAVAGEANLGTLRYLLAVPVNRTRLLAVKFAAIVTFCFASTLLVAAVGSVTGLVLFDHQSATLLSGTQASFGAALWRLLLICLYLALCMVSVGAIGMFVSTLTEQPIGATIGIVILTITSQILDQFPQLSAIGPYLPTHWWMSFADLLRDPMAFDSIQKGLLSVAVYTVLFGSLAWARFAGKDVSS
jgi:ABC-2 type transport system permease protein